MPNERHWCFTSWYEPDVFPTDQKDMEYMIFGVEKCPDTGRIHYQGYIEFRKKVSMTFVKNFISDNAGSNLSAHIERRFGTQQQAIDYCKKDGEYREYGTPNYSGKRTDLEDSLNNNATVDEFIENDAVNFVKYHRGIQAYYHHKEMKSREKFTPCKVHIYFGTAGSGKTKSVLLAVPGNDYYFWTPSTNNNSGPWFDGYCGEKHLIFDDFYGNLPYSFFLQITDPYRKPLQLPVKGGFKLAHFTDVWITSNTDPYEWYGNVKNREGLKRRLDAASIFHCTKSPSGQFMQYPYTSNLFDGFSFNDNVDEYIAQDSDVPVNNDNNDDHP